MDVREYLYFDTELVDSLYNQLFGDRLVSYSTDTAADKERSAALKPKVRLGGALRHLGLGIDVDAEGGGKNTNSTRRTESYTTTKEGTYRSVLDKMGGDAGLRKSLDQAWHQAMAKDSGCFFVGAGVFVPATGDPSTDDRWRVDANRIGMLCLVEQQDRQFSMYMSLDKITGVRDGEIKPTGHLSIRLRNSAPLQIFGKIDRTRYIKPIVVSW